MAMKLKSTEKAVRLIEAENTIVIETERMDFEELLKLDGYVASRYFNSMDDAKACVELLDILWSELSMEV